MVENPDRQVKRNNTRFRAVLGWLIFLFLVGVILFLLTLGNYQFSVNNPGGNDFFSRWNGARYWVVQGISPYDDRVGENAQMVIYGHLADISQGDDKNLFAYPLYSMLFFAPFSLFDYNIARAIWTTLLEISLVGGALISSKIAGWKLSVFGTGVIILFSLVWYYGARSIILGQFAPINALLILGAIYLIQKKQDLPAGLLIALSTIKPQMTYLLVIYTLIWSIIARRRKIAIGIIVGGLFLLLGSLILLPTWPVDWLRQVQEYPEYTSRIGSVISIIANIFPPISQPLDIILNIMAILYLLSEWALSLRKDEQRYIWVAMITLVITNFVVVRNATPHYVALLPVFFMVFRVWQERWKIKGQIISWAVVSLLVISLWVLFFLTVKDTLEQPVLFLPIPIFTLLALLGIRKELRSRPNPLNVT